MAYKCRVLLDSINLQGNRLTTFEVEMPRIVLAEFNTHRMISRNSASSRAIPVKKRIVAVEADPFVPEAFGKNRSGMQASENLDDEASRDARGAWMGALRAAVTHAKWLAEIGVHKQLANRLIEPFSWTTVICSATEWGNFFGLRCHPMAQPEIRRAAELMRDAMAASTPTHLRPRQWHAPMLDSEERAALQQWSEFDLLRDASRDAWSADDSHPPAPLPPELWISAGRCARVSYLTHDGRRDSRADVTLGQRLAADGHMSPLEHVATPELRAHGNFRGWRQLRQHIPHEADFSKRTTGGGA